MYVQPSKRIIHKGLIGPDGETSAACSDPKRAMDHQEAYAVLSEWLHDEITCPDCRAQLGLEIPGRVTRGQMLRNILAIQLNTAFFYVDANYWNREARQPGEDKINPDPDGKLAAQFLEAAENFRRFMQPIEDAIRKHEEIYGWADIITEDESK